MKTWILIAAMMLISGCSSFEHDWEMAGKTAPPADAITGRWSGTWQSKVDDHSGALRAIVTRIDDTHYQAKFHAVYGGMMTFEYTATLNAKPATDQIDLAGEEDLGWLAGGVYKYNGHATPTEFFSLYRSKYDEGTYTMKRP
ncbi:MAG: hypothetical protein GC162_01635 [Planctomycetes bacterium]|nr:hypothetical protein [Planctomycetota bacterium]